MTARCDTQRPVRQHRPYEPVDAKLRHHTVASSFPHLKDDVLKILVRTVVTDKGKKYFTV